MDCMVDGICYAVQDAGTRLTDFWGKWQLV